MNLRDLFSSKEINDMANSERIAEDARRGILNLSLLTSAQRARYKQRMKEKAYDHAYRTGLNMYNYFCPTGKVQISYPPSRLQRVFNANQNKVVTIRHFN